MNINTTIFCTTFYGFIAGNRIGLAFTVNIDL